MAKRHYNADSASFPLHSLMFAVPCRVTEAGFARRATKVTYAFRDTPSVVG
jgi:hypothetical protein